MEKEETEKYIQAGKITKEAVEKAKKSIKPGQKLLEIAESIEKSIETIGAGKAKPAFPVNLSINQNAAHYTPGNNTKETLKETDVIKVDLGTQIDGYICDTAFTLNFDNKFSKMIEAAEQALENALSIAKEGTQIGKIGQEIEKAIKSKGYNPIQNLTGHGLNQYEQHAHPSIPNIETKNPNKLESGKAYALEPFATNGQGWVKEGQQSEIFALDKPKNTRNTHARKLQEHILEEYQTTPFALRWLQNKTKMPEFQLKVAMRELQKTGAIKSFPVLHEQPGKIVTQAEKSIIIQDGKTTVLC